MRRARRRRSPLPRYACGWPSSPAAGSSHSIGPATAEPPGRASSPSAFQGPSFRAVRPGNLDVPIVSIARHAHSPWVTANLAILNEAPAQIRLDVNLDLLRAVGTIDQKTIRAHGLTDRSGPPLAE